MTVDVAVPSFASWQVEEARGGVLFIDEAYRLTPADSSKDYGKEAVETLMEYLNPPAKNVPSPKDRNPVMIFAGASLRSCSGRTKS